MIALQDSTLVSSVYDVFESSAETYAPSEFLHVADANHAGAPHALSISYRVARERVDALRRRYKAAGYVQGQRVVIALDNDPQFFLHFLALNALGCSIVPLNAAMSREEIAFQITHADAAAVISLAGHIARITAAAPEQVKVGVVGEHDDTWTPPPPLGPPSANADEAALLYTSGTTGQPKGCMLSNRYFLALGALYTSLGGYCAFRPGADRLVTPLPVTHMNALGCSFMAMLATGGCLIQLDRFHPSTWWQSVAEARATCFHYLGVMPAMLLGAPPSSADDLRGKVRFGFGAGSDPRHQANFEQRFGVPLIEAWAMTETGAGAWITASHEPRHVGARCFGRAPSGLEWRIVDEAQTDVASGSPGELLVRRAGPQPRDGFFSGYYKDAAATATAWEGGWFHTGDVVRVDSEGSFFFVDRLKNVIRRSGENIAAVEVESALLQHHAVKACAVAPVADEIRGEEVCALIVISSADEASTTLAESIQRHCLKILAYFKAPGYVCFVSQLPQTASQKLARAEIRKLALRQVESGAAFDLRTAKRRPMGN